MIDLYTQQIHDDDLVATPQDSYSRPVSHRDRKLSKTRPIKKKNKIKNTKSEKVKEEKKDEENNEKSENAIAPFSIFQSEQQKYKRLEIYFKEDIENYYRKHVSTSEIHSLHGFVSQSLIQLNHLLKSDINHIWKNNIYPQEIIAYCDLVQKCQQSKNQYILFNDTSGERFYCCFQGPCKSLVYQVSKLESQLLGQRKKFLKMMVGHQKNGEEGQGSKVSEISHEVLFLFRHLCSISKKLKSNFEEISGTVKNTMEDEASHSLSIEDDYSSYLICKNFTDAFPNKQIDFFNYFKNNQRIQNGNEEGNTIADQKEFQEFLRKKRRIKGKKSRGVLHTACLGCFSSHFQLNNPFLFCQECSVRFHRLCYTPRQDGLCEQCYVKKTLEIQKFKQNQCIICPLKGLLFTSVKHFEMLHFEKHIHIFCMLVHGLWKVQNGQLVYEKSTHSSLEQRKCFICQIQMDYSVSCQRCGKFAHASCAFLGGWNFNGRIIEGNKVQVTVKCCEGVFPMENSRRRKFITNYKKQAYLF